MIRSLLFLTTTIAMSLGVLSCSNKEINLIANIDFELLVTAPTTIGFVKDTITSQIAITPQVVDYPGFAYTLRYEVLEGEGYFINRADQSKIPATTDLPLALMEKTYPADWQYVGVSPGEHRIHLYAQDNFNRSKETELRYTFNDLALDWSVNAQPTAIAFGDRTAITLQLRNNSTERASDFIVTISNSSAAGRFLDQNENVVTASSFAIEEGTTQLFFEPTTEGEIKLTFVLTDSNGQELDDIVLLNVTKNQPPIAVDDNSFSTPANVPLELEVLNNDTDGENDTLTIVETTQTTAGAVVTMNADGTLKYTPTDQSFIGQDQFSYTISDGMPENIATATVTVLVTAPIITIAPKVVLQAALLDSSDGLMSDTLRELGYLPNLSPYGDGGTVTSRSLFMQTGTDAIVDWIWIELRDADDPTKIVASQSGFLQRDFDVVDSTGAAPLQFELPDGNYHVVIKHRNHLGIMSAAPITMRNKVTTIDFTNGTIATYGSKAQTLIGMPIGIVAMWPGDANGDGKLVVSGPEGEGIVIVEVILEDPQNISNSVDYISKGYKSTDVGMRGETNLSEWNNDNNFIKNNRGQ